MSGEETKVRHHRPIAGDEALVEVDAALEADAWHGFHREALWAEPLGEDRYLVRSTPFHAFDLAPEDIVLARAAPGLARPQIQEVVERGGSSTYRLMVRRGLEDPSFARYWAPLEELDCNYEVADPSFAAVEVPPQADLEEVYALLEEGESAGVWEFEEGRAAE